MALNDDERWLIKQQASIDQYWASFELALPWIVQLSETRISPITSDDMIELAQRCCQLVSWELALRIKQREQYVHCEAYSTIFPEEVTIRIESIKGNLTFHVPADKVLGEQGEPLDDLSFTPMKAIVRVVAVRQIDDNYSILLPTPDRDTIVVSAKEMYHN